MLNFTKRSEYTSWEISCGKTLFHSNGSPSRSTFGLLARMRLYFSSTRGILVPLERFCWVKGLFIPHHVHRSGGDPEHTQANQTCIICIRQSKKVSLTKNACQIASDRDQWVDRPRNFLKIEEQTKPAAEAYCLYYNVFVVVRRRY